MRQTSVYTPPTDSPTDTLTLAEIREIDGIYGSQSNDPTVVVIQGVAFQRQLSDGDFVGVINDAPADVRFRRLGGRLTVTIED